MRYLSRKSVGAIFASFVFLAIAARPAHADDSDQTPATIVRAFAGVTWPESLTGADSGQQLDLRPLVVTGSGDGSGALYVATQHGAILRLAPGQVDGEAQLFLDIRERVIFSPKFNEEGLLGLAFHPQFRTNGEFLVYYTPLDGDKEPGPPGLSAVISRFRVDADHPQQADPHSEEVLLRIEQPYWNHNGGTIVFGPDGYLYVGLGDGGAGNDPHMNGQNLQTLLGKILRIDVDRREGDLPYAIPADNPFASASSKLARGEIWAYGLRNVWRLAFDRETGTAWAADVGQDLWEEIDIIEKGGNYGWNLREGKHPFGPGGVEANDRLVDPIWEYHHDVGKSITGGVVYRGKAAPKLTGAYLYADYVTGQIGALWYDTAAKKVSRRQTLRERGAPVVTFGEDDAGEVYFTTQTGEFFGFAP